MKGNVHRLVTTGRYYFLSRPRRFGKSLLISTLEAYFQGKRELFKGPALEQLEKDCNVELFFQNVLFITFKMMGFYTQIEYHTNRGRVDLVLKTDEYIYVMEFKQDGTPEEALAQIHEKGYAQPFETDERKLFKIGANFSTDERNIERWLVEA